MRVLTLVRDLADAREKIEGRVYNQVRPQGAIGNKGPDRADELWRHHQPAFQIDAGERQPPLVPNPAQKIASRGLYMTVALRTGYLEELALAAN